MPHYRRRHSHRVCAGYSVDDDADIPCRIVDWPKASDVPASACARLKRRAESQAGDPGLPDCPIHFEYEQHSCCGLGQPTIVERRACNSH